MRYKPINAQLFVDNRRRLAAMLKPSSVAVVVANDEMPRNGDQFFPYRQNSDLFYLTGIEQEKTLLLLCPTHPQESYREVLFIVKADPLEEQWNGHKLTLEEARAISGVKSVKYLDALDVVLRELFFWAKRAYLAINEYPKFFPEVPNRDVRFAKQIKEQYPLLKIKRLFPLIAALRQVKQPEEVGLIKRACEITGVAFDRILKSLAPGMKEYEVEAMMTYDFLRLGANGHAYQPIVASGKNACVLHYVTNDGALADGDLLLMDFGAEYANYAADCSRTIPVNGKFTPRQKACYNAVLRTFRKAQSLYVPGNTIQKINQAVFKMMEEEMIGLGLFTREEVERQDPQNPCYAKYLMHGVCHPVGLDVHDVGGKEEPLPEGQVLTLEPGIYLEEEGFGIRLENDIMVADVPVDLMAHIPIEVDEIEALMASADEGGALIEVPVK
ncbi:MAG: X-Pro aminopeptidase [Bacteroidetes bacterium]|nr:MAG: X-Pro aminopeptidase [Bacteroidota bacterium]PIE88701.1 MAG: X-Pro aminopeptidase [Bacteroidota bacterium]